MSTVVVGLYDTRDDAEEAKKALFDAGFSHAEVTLETFDKAGVDNQERAGENAWDKFVAHLKGLVSDPEGDFYANGLAHGQTLVSVTSPDDVDEQKAVSILRSKGSLNISEHAQRYHANTLIPDPDYQIDKNDYDGHTRVYRSGTDHTEVLDEGAVIDSNSTGATGIPGVAGTTARF